MHLGSERSGDDVTRGLRFHDISTGPSEDCGARHRWPDTSFGFMLEVVERSSDINYGFEFSL